MHLPPDSVRGRIRGWLEQYAELLDGPVVEVGSRLPSAACWWADNRPLRPDLQWVGVDMEAGEGVDVLAMAEVLPEEWTGRFGGAVCSEMLEHVRRPDMVLSELHRVLRPSAAVIVTTLTAFQLHGYPDDYWRFTPSGLTLLLERAGFVEIVVASAGELACEASDHGEAPVRIASPMHVFAVARRGSGL